MERNTAHKNRLTIYKYPLALGHDIPETYFLADPVCFSAYGNIIQLRGVRRPSFQFFHPERHFTATGCIRHYGLADLKFWNLHDNLPLNFA